jgi:uncharacterized membrane protein YeaQ/YmgE (transglycosylase-associated protein family)
MNIFIWLLAGGLLGFLGYSLLRLNVERGKMVSIAIGAVGGFIGGKMIAPVFTAAAAIPSDFNMSALIVAAIVATAFLALGNLVQNRWGV